MLAIRQFLRVGLQPRFIRRALTVLALSRARGITNVMDVTGLFHLTTTRCRMQNSSELFSGYYFFGIVQVEFIPKDILVVLASGPP